MDVRGSGGGYFYGPFTSTQGIGPFINITPDAAPLVYGAWNHMAVPVLTGRGRWLQLNIWPNAYGALYFIQIGRGAAGSEILFQPSDGTGFSINWVTTGIMWNVPYTISFPTSTGIGNELAIRCSSFAGGGPNLSAEIYLWN